MHDNTVSLSEADTIVDQWTSIDPLSDIKAFHERFRMPEIEGLPKFTGGLVGFFGYDTIRYIEPTLESGRKPKDMDIPDICLMVSDEVVVFDNLSGRLFIVIYVDVARGGDWDSGVARLEALAEKLRAPIESRPALSLHQKANEGEFESSLGQQAYERAVEKSRRIHSGRRCFPGCDLAAPFGRVSRRSGGSLPCIAYLEPLTLHVLSEFRLLPHRGGVA